MRQFAIGDIHGCLKALQHLDRTLHFDSSDTIITLGDYIDRGPDSRGVIDYLIDLQKRSKLITLRGNHEIMMLGARNDRAMLLDWISCGGDRTMDSYAATSFDEIPARHWQFLEETLPFHDAPHDFFVHANAYADFDLIDQPDYMLYWEFFGEPQPHRSGKRMICGHSAQKSGHPLNIGHAVCIDTYAHGGGWLTCLETKSNIYWQTSEQGGLRSDSLV